MPRIINFQSFQIPPQILFNHCSIFLRLGSVHWDLCTFYYHDLMNINQNGIIHYGSKIKLPQDIEQIDVIVDLRILNLQTEPVTIKIMPDQKFVNNTCSSQKLLFHTELGTVSALLRWEQQVYLPNRCFSDISSSEASRSSVNELMIRQIDEDHNSNIKFSHTLEAQARNDKFLQQQKTKHGDSERTNYSKIDKSKTQARSEKLLFDKETNKNSFNKF